MGQSNMRMGVTSAAKQSVTPAQTLPDFNVTSSELLADDYDTAPLLAWLGADWIANGYRVISEYRVAIPQITATAPARQSADTPILESA